MFFVRGNDIISPSFPSKIKAIEEELERESLRASEAVRDAERYKKRIVVRKEVFFFLGGDNGFFFPSPSPHFSSSSAFIRVLCKALAGVLSISFAGPDILVQENEKLYHRVQKISVENRHFIKIMYVVCRSSKSNGRTIGSTLSLLNPSGFALKPIV